MNEYKRTLAELREKATLYWSQDLLEQAGEASILPLLLKTQDKFISVLTLADGSPDAWKKFIDVSEDMKGNIFLKHLMVLSDLGGEALNKYPPLSKFFPSGLIEYVWNEQSYTYEFKVISGKASLINSSLLVDGKNLLKGRALNDKMEDVVMLLLYASSSINNDFPDDAKEKCLIGSLLGKSEELKKFVKQNYIRVSRQIGGANAAKLGKVVEEFVFKILRRELPDWTLRKNGKIPGISHSDDGRETSFDIVATSPSSKYFAIEISFQFTTNGTIERKAREAKDRAAILHKSDHFVCYVVDGAGNINIRENAVRTICQYSDCTVAFSEAEIVFLSEFMKEKSGQ
ncbi:MAG: restriction endonuclease [Leptolyngbyaceae cyanobacterium SM1_4_3]|nr:restriction endonuclease [Leptolyngbyaceae cyanobacterium SM1_4_3]